GPVQRARATEVDRLRTPIARAPLQPLVRLPDSIFRSARPPASLRSCPPSTHAVAHRPISTAPALVSCPPHWLVGANRLPSARGGPRPLPATLVGICLPMPSLRPSFATTTSALSVRRLVRSRAHLLNFAAPTRGATERHHSAGARSRTRLHANTCCARS